MWWTLGRIMESVHLSPTETRKQWCKPFNQYASIGMELQNRSVLTQSFVKSISKTFCDNTILNYTPELQGSPIKMAKLSVTMEYLRQFSRFWNETFLKYLRKCWLTEPHSWQIYSMALLRYAHSSLREDKPHPSLEYRARLFPTMFWMQISKCLLQGRYKNFGSVVALLPLHRIFLNLVW